MHEYVSYVLHLVREDGALALLVVLLLLLAARAVFLVRRSKGSAAAFPWGRAVALALLAGYLAALISMTLTGRADTGVGVPNFHWFRAWREAWNNFSVKNWLLVLLNVAAFVPLGVLLPLVGKWFRRWYVTVPTGFLVSLAIETLQHLTNRGTFDVDDLFTNTLGTALGFSMVLLVLLLLHRETRAPRRWLPYLACPLVFCLAVGGIFAVYAWQPYGNLSIAPAFRSDLRGIAITASRDWDETARTATIYRAPAMTKSTCDAFGSDFAAAMDITFPSAYYYDDMTIFANHTTGDFLTVDYRDGSYTYRIGTPPAVEESEASLQDALSQLGITVPAGAAFSQESETRFVFTIDFLTMDGTLYDGTIRCRVQDGTLSEVENHMIALTPQAEESIRSEAEAYDQLLRGDFASASSLAKRHPDAVTVTDCVLDYQIDTKGFYQPVYRFSLIADGTQMADALIPALP